MQVEIFIALIILELYYIPMLYDTGPIRPGFTLFDCYIRDKGLRFQDETHLHASLLSISPYPVS